MAVKKKKSKSDSNNSFGGFLIVGGDDKLPFPPLELFVLLKFGVVPCLIADDVPDVPPPIYPVIGCGSVLC